MRELHEPDTTTLEAPKRRTAAERFANLSDRLARTLPAPARAEPVPVAAPAAEPDYEDYPDENGEDTSWYEVVPRFPLARSGYDCAAVDEHVAMLERDLSELEEELEELRTRTPAHDEVAAEIRRLGEETSSILLAAHDRARETTRQAQEQADRCLSDAAAQALAMTEQAARQRTEIEQDTRRLAERRAQLLSDMETLAGTITGVAREASGRFSELREDAGEGAAPAS